MGCIWLSIHLQVTSPMPPSILCLFSCEFSLWYSSASDHNIILPSFLFVLLLFLLQQLGEMGAMAGWLAVAETLTQAVRERERDREIQVSKDAVCMVSLDWLFFSGIPLCKQCTEGVPTSCPIITTATSTTARIMKTLAPNT